MSRQYIVAGKCVEAVLNGQSFKSYCAKIKLGKIDYALACESLKYLEVIKTLYDKISLDILSPDFDCNPGIFIVMTYEMLFGAHKIQGGGKVKRMLLQHYEKLRLMLDKLMTERNITSFTSLTSKSVSESANLPKYVRVNPLRISSNLGLKAVKEVCPEAEWDPDIPFLIKLPPTSKSLGEHKSVKSGELIIQDKASCFPSQILFDEWEKRKIQFGGDIIDACAAPGNKTSHLASLVFRHKHYNGERIFAFDKSENRADLLRRRLQQAAANKVVVQHADFLNVDHADPQYKSVRFMLLDPSCSGSGVARAWERVVESNIKDNKMNAKNSEKVDESDSGDVARLLKLQEFQLAALRKAAQFPSLEVIVYSTCSIHQLENEDVVYKFLAENSEWDVEPPGRFKDWKRRGFSIDSLPIELSESLIRCEPIDGLNGFFVALFVKKGISSEIGRSSRDGKAGNALINSEMPVQNLLRKRILMNDDSDSTADKKRPRVAFRSTNKRSNVVGRRKRKLFWYPLSSIKYHSTF
jgi:putative methyltransferase